MIHQQRRSTGIATLAHQRRRRSEKCKDERRHKEQEIPRASRASAGKMASALGDYARARKAVGQVLLTIAAEQQTRTQRNKVDKVRKWLTRAHHELIEGMNGQTRRWGW